MLSPTYPGTLSFLRRRAAWDCSTIASRMSDCVAVTYDLRVTFSDQEIWITIRMDWS